MNLDTACLRTRKTVEGQAHGAGGGGWNRDGGLRCRKSGWSESVLRERKEQAQPHSLDRAGALRQVSDPALTLHAARVA
eukprot:scaffold187460_cov35-Tisochrysis_lutea.AAC.1